MSTMAPSSILPAWLEHNLNRLLVFVISLLLLGHLLTLTLYPTVFIDEGWLANTSWSWLTTGVNFDLMSSGPLDQFGYEWATEYFAGEIPYMLAFSTLGLGLFQARLVAWLFGVVLVFALVQVGRHCYSLRTGLLAALLLVLSVPFLQSSRWRQDIMLAAVIMLSFWLALYAFRSEKAWPHFLSGLLLGIGFDVHQTAMIFIPALAALYLAQYGLRLVLKRGTWLAGLGGALAMGIYAAIHILPSPEVFSLLNSFYFTSGAEAQFPIMQPATILESAIRELGRYRFRENVFDLALIALAGLFLLYRRSRSDRLVLTFTGASYLSFILLSGNKTFLYAINLYPFFMLIVAEAFVSLLRVAQRPLVSRLAAVVLVVFIGYGVVRTTLRISENIGYDYYAVTDEIHAEIPAGARVMGMPTWWLGLADTEYRSSLNLTYYNFFNDYSLAEAFAAIRPDYVIVDDTQHLLLVEPDQELDPGLNVYRILRDDFEAVLETRGQLVHNFADPWHGYFEVYQIDWDT
jgi:4-amino-4-deoxy-L-arabinose transferase-like glycosyltransferase